MSQPKHRKHFIIAAFLLVVLLFSGLAPAYANSTPQPLPFAQDWTNTDLITTDDDWSNVPGIVGYLGEDNTTTTAPIDPRTVLDERMTTVNVMANKTNPNLTTGGVAEFHLSNPVVALQASGTADSPFILINLNTSGYTHIQISYNLRDIDGSSDDAVQPVALQYRVGNSGTFINIDSAYVADATEGPNLAGKVTPVSVTLPPAAANQPLVQVRIITGNASGNDEWVGIDDLQVRGDPLGATDESPYVISTTPANGANNVALNSPLTVAFSEAVTVNDPWFHLSCQHSGTHTATVSGGPTTFTIDPATDFGYSETCTLTILASAVLDQDPPVQPMAADYVLTFNTTPPSDVCGDPYIPISDLQGTGLISLYRGATIATEGVVTAVFQGTGKLGGFFLSALDGAQDDDPQTSEGIFVYAPSASVKEGDHVRVRGVAQEYSGSYGAMAQMTEIGGSTTVKLCAQGLSITPVPLSMPLPADADPATYLERYEGMLVTISQPLTVQQTYFLGRFGQMTLGVNGRIYTPLNTGSGSYQDALRRIIILDDGATVQNPNPIPYYANDGAVRAGDVIPTLTGVLDQGRINSSTTESGYPAVYYRIHPTLPPAFESQNPRPPAPQKVDDTLRVASINVLNYFVTLNQTPYPPGSPYSSSNTPRGANTPEEFSRQQEKIVSALEALNADIIGLIEIEAWPGADAVNNLVNALNARLRSNKYAAVPDPVTGVGNDAIKVALIYKTTRVERVGNSLSLSAYPFSQYRYPVAQAFRDKTTGEVFSVIINHFKSKSCSGTPGEGDTDPGEGVGCYNATRVRMAEVLVGWINNTLIPTVGDADVIVMGDLNAYTSEDPLQVLENAGLRNIGKNFEGDTTYSYVFDGMAGALDHILVTPSLFQAVTRGGHWHINADEPAVIDYNVEFKTVDLYQNHPYRSSDHDPILLDLNLQMQEALHRLFLPLITR